MQITPVEARVLGSLMEKESTTPDLYPLSLNALMAACNQKSSREPVMVLTEGEVRDALRSLEDLDLVSVDHGSRVARYENRARTVFQLRRDEAAVLCLLLLRGPQTPGELRSRADRLHTFDDISAVISALTRLSVPQENRPEPLVALLERQPGNKEQRYAHLLAGQPPLSRAAAGPGSGEPPAVRQGSLAERVTELEAEVRRLGAELERLSQQAGFGSTPGPAQEESPEEA